MIKNGLGITNRKATKKDAESFIINNELIVIGRKKGKKSDEPINLFNDLKLYDFQVEEDVHREINTKDFFKHLDSFVSMAEIERLVDSINTDSDSTD